MPKRPHFYKIGDACKLLDIQPYVLRYWETEFSALRPSKSKSGQRVYSEAEIEVIRRIKILLYDEGYTIAGAKKRLETELESVPIRGLFEDAETLAPSSVEEEESSEPPAAASAVAPPPAPQPTPRPAGRRAPATAAAAPLLDIPPPAVPEDLLLVDPLDTAASQRIETLRRGIAEALAEARSLQSLLDTKPVESES